MTVFDLTGLLTGAMGLALAALGALLAFFAGLRLLFLIRKPGKGRIARGFAVAGVVLILCGAVLLAGEELDVFRRSTDRAAYVLTALSVLVAGFAGVRAARKKAAGAAQPPVRVEAAEKGEAQG